MTTAATSSEATTTAGRLLSLDAYRGFIMICLTWGGFGLGKFAELKLRTQPDSGWWQFLHAQFDHGPWAGWGFWDLIMPAFMFMVGMAMPFSEARRQREGQTRGQIARHTLIRSGVLILLGIFLASHGKPREAWTLTNTLAQIGLCYPLAALCVSRGYRVQATVAGVSLIGTWLLFVLHGGSPQLGPGITPEWAAVNHAGIGQAWWKNSNVAHAFDVWFLNLFPQNAPFTANEGGYHTLSFLPSLATMIAGIMCASWVRERDTANLRILRVLLIAGAALVLAGEILGHSGLCPLVKRIWTPSFSLVCTGMCVLMLAAFYYIVDMRGWRRWTFPFIVAGANSIALYMMSQLLKPWVADLWRRYLGRDAFLFAGPEWESVLRYPAIGFTFWLVAWWMYRNKIFVRI
jgi:heparan-alpha-glucosaminide N-acetyltransferase